MKCNKVLSMHYKQLKDRCRSNMDEHIVQNETINYNVLSTVRMLH